MTIATATTTSVNPSSGRLISAIAITDPTKTSAPDTASTRPEVTTDRSSVVSDPTLDTRSPVRLVSNSSIGSRNIRSTSNRRVSSTTPSAVRCSRYCCIPLITAVSSTNATRPTTIPVSGRDCCTDPITRPTIAGWATDNSAPTIEMAVTSSSTLRCGRRYGHSNDNRARGATAASRSTSITGPSAAVTITGSGSVRVALLTCANVIICRPVARHFLVRRNRRPPGPHGTSRGLGERELGERWTT